MSTFREQLIKLDACHSAIKWVGERDLQTVWIECFRADWMMWLAVAAGVDERIVVVAALDVAEVKLGRVVAPHPSIRASLDVTRRWTIGEATIAEVHAARARIEWLDNDDYNAAVAVAASAAGSLAVSSDLIDRALYAQIVRERIPVELVAEAIARKS